jgi:hypothetical protein
VKRVAALRHQFVEYMPDALEEGVIHISIFFATAIHRCCCGCGSEVVTPLSPTDWALTYDGETVSLDPSVGNWGFPCRSHYWIECNRVVWAPQWMDWQIAEGRVRNLRAKERRAQALDSGLSMASAFGKSAPVRPARPGFWARLRQLLQ